jgi:ornithine cyclodeaminase
MALKEGIINQDALMELGVVLQLGVSQNTKTIIADFSGIGAQDVAMAQFVLSRLVPS